MFSYEENKEYLGEFHKEFPEDEIWWIDDVGRYGSMLFSFDKKTIFNFWADYPHNLTAEQKQLFDKECPELAELYGE